MKTERITAESIRRIDHVDEYVKQFEDAMVNGNHSGAIDALDKMQILIKQCKRDAQELERPDKDDKDCKEYPKYVALRGIALRHKGDGLYYRDAGMWELRAGWRNGRLVCITRVGPMKRNRGEELVEISCEQWMKGNDGYV